MKPSSTTIFYLIILSATIIFNSCSSDSSRETSISWDRYGVPHIKAKSTDDLFFAQGWALMQNHANKVLELYGKSRGRASEYWGEQYLQNDILIHTLGFEELSKEWDLNQLPELKSMYNNFVKGINAFTEFYPERINEKNKVVLPVTQQDVNMHGMFVVFTRFIGGSDLGLAQRWTGKGSNTYAIGPSRSASGNALLVQNPHLPWSNEFLFTEYHFNLNGRNLYGANIIGMPGIAIGFNESLGWSHTDNTIDNSDTYELDLVDGNYLLDGKQKKFQTRTKTIQVKQLDGTTIKRDLTILKSEHGPIIKKSNEKAIAIRLAGTDRSNMFLQWWKMLNSKNFSDFESALKMAQIPFWNVMYADREGNIFYLFNGLVPKRKQQDWEYWNRIIPGGKSEDIWSEYHSYDELPKLKNPQTGWLQNANDPPWTSTIPIALNHNDYPGYMAPVHMYLRPQISAKMIIRDSSITLDELVQYKHSTHIELADRILDDLMLAIDRSGSTKAKKAKKILMNWDRKADTESEAMLLFHAWASKLKVFSNETYKTPWDINNPISTPSGLADPTKALMLFEESIEQILATFGKLDVKWGDYYRIVYNDKNLPSHGSHGRLGIFRVVWPFKTDKKNMLVGGGDSWVSVVEFGKKIKAKALLSYGNSTETDSPHNGDQLDLFSKSELRDVWFYENDVKKNTVRKEVKREDRFIKN